MLHTFLDSKRASFYLVFRLLVGVMFLFHGLQKFGLIGDAPAVALRSLMGLAAVIETFGGLAIVLGAFTRVAAVFGGFTMIAAIGMVHLPTSIVFTNNGGELAFMYLAAFLVLATFGPGTKWVLRE